MKVTKLLFGLIAMLAIMATLVACKDDDNEETTVPAASVPMTSVSNAVVEVARSNEPAVVATPPPAPTPRPSRPEPEPEPVVVPADPPTPPTPPKYEISLSNAACQVVWSMINGKDPFEVVVSNSVQKNCPSGTFELYFETGAGQQEWLTYQGNRNYSFLFRDSARVPGLTLLSEGPIPGTEIRVINNSTSAVPVTVVGPEEILASGQSHDWNYRDTTPFTITYNDTQSEVFVWGDTFVFKISDSADGTKKVLTGGPK